MVVGELLLDALSPVFYPSVYAAFFWFALVPNVFSLLWKIFWTLGERILGIEYNEPGPRKMMGPGCCFARSTTNSSWNYCCRGVVYDLDECMLNLTAQGLPCFDACSCYGDGGEAAWITCFISDKSVPMLVTRRKEMPEQQFPSDAWVKIEFEVAKAWSRSWTKAGFAAALEPLDEKYFKPHGYALRMAKADFCCGPLCGFWANIAHVVVKASREPAAAFGAETASPHILGNKNATVEV
jgi:hypothetical protein